MAVILGVKIEEVNNHPLDGVNHRLAVEMVVGEGITAFDIVEIEHTHLLLLGVEPHDGVVEQGQMPLHAIVALWGTDLDKLLRHIHHIDHEIRALFDMAHCIATGQNKTIAYLETERLIIKNEGAVTLSAKSMGEIARITLIGDVGQRVLNDDVGAVVHGAKV